MGRFYNFRASSPGKFAHLASFFVLVFSLGVPFLLLAQTTVFINEIHYDNNGTDENEAVEVAGPAGTDLTGWKIVRYNGSDGKVYSSPAANPPGSDTFSSSIPNLCDGYGVLVVYYQANGLQNGAPDGIALVDNQDHVIQLLSYEGTLTATDGPASGMTSTDMGVSETSSTEIGFSLRLSGTGSVYEDFTWNVPASASFGSCNTGQTFTGGSDSAPFIASTVPPQAETNVAADANIVINFNESVTVTGNWFTISGSLSGSHSAAVSGGPQSYTLDPTNDFNYQETVTVTIFAAAVSDNDSQDPPDNMNADYTFSFTTTAEPGQWIINEIHADPDATNGDANGDGVVNTSEDEFIEIVNISGAQTDISGWTISDEVGVRHTFPAGSQIPNDCAVVIFGGGTPAGEFGKVVVQTASTGQLGLNNTGDTVTLNNGTAAVSSYHYGSEGGDNQSLTRDPDITGPEPLIKHSTTTGSGGALFSPGTKINGTPFSGCEIQIPVVEIFAIQGSGMASPYRGQTVTTENNVVTAICSDGFCMQTPGVRTDGNPETSDGIFVYTSTLPAVAIGDYVTLTGEVIEFNGLTEFSNNPSVTVISSGNPLPEPVQLNQTTPSPSQPQPETELERYEGMRMEMLAGMATGATDEYGNPKVVAKSSRTFREPGIVYPGVAGLPVWDGNPEIFELDPDRLGLTNIEMFAGTEFTAVGVLGYSFGDYQLWPASLTITKTPTLPVAARMPGAGEVTVAVLNLWQLFRNEPDPVSYQDRLAKFSQYIRDLLHTPQILAVQEAADINTLQDLANKITQDDPKLIYSAYLIEGNDASGIDVGFLVLADVQVKAVIQLGARETFSYDGSLLHDRPPLQLDAELANGNSITVLNLHLRSMNGIDDPQEGERVRLKRHEQATSVSRMVQNLQDLHPDIHLIVGGDFNAFEFTDGYVDVLGQIMGTPSDATQAMIPGTDEVNPNLDNQVVVVDPLGRYSYVKDGTAQVLDHILTSHPLASRVTGIQYIRANSDAPNRYKTDADTPIRCSDHDGLMVYLTFENRYDVSGTIIYDNADRPVSGTILELIHPDGTCADTTHEDGTYLFENKTEAQAQLLPSKEGDTRDAITGSDALRVLQYLAFLIEMSAEQKVTADVTEDGQVTGSDAWAILRYLAFFTDYIAATGQWRFAPTDTAFVLNSSKKINFNAYLMGDTNLSWGESSIMPNIVSLEKIQERSALPGLSLEPVICSQSGEVRLPIFLQTGAEIVHTLIFSLTYNPADLKFASNHRTPLSDSFLVCIKSDEPGIAHVAMVGVAGIASDGVILNLVFTRLNPEFRAENPAIAITRALINDRKVRIYESENTAWAQPDSKTVPDHLDLLPNYPNPFNPDTRILFQLPERRWVQLQVFNLLGNHVRTLIDEEKPTGFYDVIWDGKDAAGKQVTSGIYFLVIQAGDWRTSQKMLKIQ